ncbi:toprim domain-containing protein [Psychrobacillus psychrodurans]|uniref:Toprim domain-containing protein n=1 Tax=Psychrobacillus psychrodurans TaxID=126157 RepID=A0A9X3LCJ4_9BACI|nr:toprim domain-containing protein [Psychrobacillus psychrodurans]MCZ8535438.1 toprim domain-containing protein [Psychrobacillus psychrodurans]
MAIVFSEKIIIVEGRSDKLKLLKLLDESTEIICTNGTISNVKLEEILSPYDGIPIYAFLDADKSGEQIRSIVRKEYPEAIHLYTNPMYCEVATTPFKVLASILKSVNIKVKKQYLL